MITIKIVIVKSQLFRIFFTMTAKKWRTGDFMSVYVCVLFTTRVSAIYATPIDRKRDVNKPRLLLSLASDGVT